MLDPSKTAFFLPGRVRCPLLYRFSYKPTAFVYPTDSNGPGVAAAVKCGMNKGIKGNARRGGLSCEYQRLHPFVSA